MTVRANSDGETLETRMQEAKESTVVREIPLTFSQTLRVDTLEIEVLSIFDGEIAHVHLWEVILE